MTAITESVNLVFPEIATVDTDTHYTLHKRHTLQNTEITESV